MTKMAAWGTMPARKMIDGHWYTYHASYTTKFDAKQVAREIRNAKTHIEKARVVVQHITIDERKGYKRYHVYTRVLRGGRRES